MRMLMRCRPKRHWLSDISRKGGGFPAILCKEKQ